MNRDDAGVLNPRDRRNETILNGVADELQTNHRYITIFNAMVRAKMICQNINYDNDLTEQRIEQIQRIKRGIASNVCYLYDYMPYPVIRDDFILAEANDIIVNLQTELFMAIVENREERETEIRQYIENFNILIDEFRRNLDNNMQRGGKNKSRRKNKKSRKSRKSRKQ